MTSENPVRKFRVRGHCCAPVTPFKDNGDLDLEFLPKYVDHCKEFDVAYVFVNGSTGEGNNMTIEERKLAAEAWIKASRGKLQGVIVHVGSANLRESQQLASHAQASGADAIAAVCPTYFKPVDVQDQVEYMAQLASAAPKLPFFIYDIDILTGIKHNLTELFHLAKDRIPTLCGVKHTTSDFSSMHSLLVNFGDQFQVMLGNEEQFIEGLSLGIDVTVMNSFSGKFLTRLRDAFKRGDIENARKEQAHAIQMGGIRQKLKFQYSVNSKAFLTACVGLDSGPPRVPIRPPTAQQMVELKQDLTKIGYFDWGLK